MNVRVVVLACVFVLVGTGLGRSDDVQGPAWRLQDPSIFAEWDTWQEGTPLPGPLLPDQWSSDPEIVEPQGWVTIGQPAYRPSYTPPGGQTRQKVIKLDSDYEMLFWLPNHSPGARKHVW